MYHFNIYGFGYDGITCTKDLILHLVEVIAKIVLVSIAMWPNIHTVYKLFMARTLQSCIKTQSS